MLWVGVVIGAAIAAVVGGPLASRWSLRAEARWDRKGEVALAEHPGLQRQVEQLADDGALFTAYQGQYWTWAALVGGGIVATAVVGSLTAWALDRGGRPEPAAWVAIATALVVGGATMFWFRKLVAKRRITRLVYLARLRTR
jgi:hypothetical protein